mmetsp:Transcript_31744/g.62863  ORF Transcript_31744/g.62863 Transcript_31744/m.62863 type:complete len:226 (-) Transcript_31744:837-1514(-)
MHVDPHQMQRRSIANRETEGTDETIQTTKKKSNSGNRISCRLQKEFSTNKMRKRKKKGHTHTHTHTHARFLLHATQRQLLIWTDGSTFWTIIFLGLHKHVHLILAFLCVDPPPLHRAPKIALRKKQDAGKEAPTSKVFLPKLPFFPPVPERTGKELREDPGGNVALLVSVLPWLLHFSCMCVYMDRDIRLPILFSHPPPNAVRVLCLDDGNRFFIELGGVREREL